LGVLGWSSGEISGLGIRWKPPFSYDVTGLVRPGKNRLAVKITNVWANRLVGDALLPKEKRITRITQKVGIDGPFEAGLFGPVQLVVVATDSSVPHPKANKQESSEPEK